MWLGIGFASRQRDAMTLLYITQSKEISFFGLKDTNLWTGFFGPRSDNVHGGSTPFYVAVTFFHQAAKQTSLMGNYLVSFTYPFPVKVRVHCRRSQGHILTLYIKRPNLLKLNTYHLLRQFTSVKLPSLSISSRKNRCTSQRTGVGSSCWQI